MALTAIMPFGLLDLPVEIRKMIFEELFAESSIVIRHRPARYGPGCVDTLTQEADLTNYHPAITFTSHQMRGESVDILERTTLLCIVSHAAEDVDKYLNKFSLTMLSRLQRLSWMQTFRSYAPAVSEVVRILSGLKTISVSGDFSTGWETQTAHETLDLFNDWYQEPPFGCPGHVASLAGLKWLARGWLETSYEDVEHGQSHARITIVMIVPFESNPGDLSTTKYGLITYDGTKTASRELRKEEALDPDYLKMFEV